MEKNKASEHKYGQTINEIKIGDTFSVTEAIRERDVLLYMGVTGDANPTYFANKQSSLSSNSKLLVPPIALMGVITKTISMNFPGPGSTLIETNINLQQSIYQDTTISMLFEVTRVEELKEYITIRVDGTNEKGEHVLDAMLTVVPAELNLTSETNTVDSTIFKKITGGEKAYYDE